MQVVATRNARIQSIEHRYGRKMIFLYVLRATNNVNFIGFCAPARDVTYVWAYPMQDAYSIQNVKLVPKALQTNDAHFIDCDRFSIRRFSNRFHL